MILEIKGTLVNAFIEPQFKEVSSGHLVTVQFSDLDVLSKFKHHMQGDTRIDLTDKYFHFTGYTQLLDLNCHISGTRIALEDLLVSRDVSPAPAAYSWQGWEDDIEDEDGNPIQGDDWRGYSLPEEIEDARWALPVSLMEFCISDI